MSDIVDRLLNNVKAQMDGPYVSIKENREAQTIAAKKIVMLQALNKRLHEQNSQHIRELEEADEEMFLLIQKNSKLTKFYERISNCDVTDYLHEIPAAIEEYER